MGDSIRTVKGDYIRAVKGDYIRTVKDYIRTVKGALHQNSEEGITSAQSRDNMDYRGGRTAQ